MLVVCRECGTSKVAEGPSAAGTCSCGVTLPKMPTGSNKGLDVVERVEASARGRGSVVSIGLPRQNAAVTLLFGLIWAGGFGMLALLVWMASGAGGGFFVVAFMVGLAGVGLVARGATDLTNRVVLTVSSTELRVDTAPIRFAKACTMHSADVLGFTVRRNDAARYVVYALRRDGRSEAVPCPFDRLTNAVWLAERLEELVLEHRAHSAYRGLVTGD